MKTTRECFLQLNRSERGAAAARMLLEFFQSPTIQHLDGPNSEAAATLVVRFMLGSGAESCEVMDTLRGRGGEQP